MQEIISVSCSLFSVLWCFVVAAFVAYVVSNRKKDGGGGGLGGPPGGAPLPTGPVLPVKWPLGKDESPWYFIAAKQGTGIKVVNGAFVFPIKKGLYGSKSGDYFKANPNKVFPAERVTMSYSVYFPEGFDWVKGGKLPGVCFSSKPLECSTGGEWSPDSGSFRVMFRENGAAIGYAYFSGASGEAAFARQSAAVKAVGKVKGGAGIDLWHAKNDTDLRLNAGQWNTISFSIKLNTPNSADGTLSLTVNNRTKTLDGISWRTDASIKFNHVIFVTFFGGGSSEWASKKDTEISFKDVGIAAS